MPNDKNIKSVERLTEKMSRAKSIYFTILSNEISEITALIKFSGFPVDPILNELTSSITFSKTLSERDLGK